MTPRFLLLTLTLGFFAGAAAVDIRLQPQTGAAFDAYAQAAEARMEDDASTGKFLIVDALPERRRNEVYEQLRRGEIYIEQLRTRQDDQPIPVPKGMIHHWAGVVFIPQGTLAEALAVIEDYANQEAYKPSIRHSKLIERNGDASKIFLQFFSKSMIAVVENVNFDAMDTQFSAKRREIACRSTRIAEVADPDTPQEHELPVGDDHGYLWRLNTYWRIEEKDGGVYVQNESIALTRTIPFLLAWFINPLVKSIPRTVITNLLNSTRKGVLKSPESSWEQTRDFKQIVARAIARRGASQARAA